MTAANARAKRMDWSKARWRKSSHSSGDGGECLEVARHENVVMVRDSKNPGGPRLVVSPEEFCVW